MDFGDIILGIVDVGILVGIFVSFYQMICTKKRIKTNGCKAALKKLLFVRRISVGNWDNSIVGCALSAICYLHME